MRICGRVQCADICRGVGEEESRPDQGPARGRARAWGGYLLFRLHYCVILSSVFFRHHNHSLAFPTDCIRAFPDGQEWESRFSAASSSLKAVESKRSIQQTMIDHLSSQVLIAPIFLSFFLYIFFCVLRFSHHQKHRGDTHVLHLRMLYSTFGVVKKLARVLYDDCSCERFERMTGIESPTVCGSLFRIVPKEKESKVGIASLPLARIIFFL